MLLYFFKYLIMKKTNFKLFVIIGFLFFLSSCNLFGGTDVNSSKVVDNTNENLRIEEKTKEIISENIDTKVDMVKEESKEMEKKDDNMAKDESKEMEVKDDNMMKDELKEIENKDDNMIKEESKVMVENETTVWEYKDYSKEVLSNTDWDIVLFFHTDWCPTCVAFEKQVLSETIPSWLTIFKVDYDDSNDLKQKYKVLTQTTFVQVDSKWNMIKKWVWWRGIDSIIEKIQK